MMARGVQARWATIVPGRLRPRGAIALGVALAAGSALPFAFGSPLLLTLLTQAAITGLLATGVGFLLRQNGLVSFGHSLFFGMAGYAIGIVLKHRLFSAEFAVVAALGVPTVLAFGLGLVIVRMPGIAFSMLTLAVGQAFYELAFKWRELANGDDGLAIDLPRRIFGIPVEIFQRPDTMFVVCWTALVVTIGALAVLSRSGFGRLTDAIRENEERSRFIGYETVVPRAAVYAVSAWIAASAGVLGALYNAFVSPEALHWSLSGTALIMAVVGGPRLLWGPALGAGVYFFFKDLAGDVTEHWPAIIGGLLIAVTVLMPGGIGAGLQALARRLAGRQAP
jgi:branched-chain amino acid transport system permease protein